MSENISLIVSSGTGAKNVSSDGSTFTVQYDSPFGVPSDAKNVYVSVEESEIWWNIFNVVAGVNDQFKIVSDGSGSAPSPNTYNNTVTITPGLYDPKGINKAIQQALSNDGADPKLIDIVGDNNTQRVQISALYTGISIDFTIANSFRVLLGYDSQVLGPSTIQPTYWLGDSLAAFNTVKYFLIHSDIVDQGIPSNGIYNSIIAQVLIDVRPGSQITYKPFHPSKSSANILKGTKNTSYRFWLTDQSNNLINTNDETWSCRLLLEWDEKQED
jgi:hypothetical protein